MEPASDAPPHTDAGARLVRERIRSRLFHRAPAPVRVGRYLVLERLGTGGFGEVYAAQDDRLQRRVALKIVRRDRRGAPRIDALLREARALARLSHPNVVEVFDVFVVERDDDLVEIVIAMELVTGEPARAWIARARPQWRELVHVFLEAGRGLAAAHRAGVIHRDFKPANVMIGSDGRVRVVDFGIASLETESEAVAAVDAATVPAAGDETARGYGTPAYMSPEQHAGDELDARTDQFSFCAALWEALFGELPYKSTVLDVGRTWPPPTPSELALPKPLRRALARGLALDARSRFADMDALLQALMPTTSRAWWMLGLGGVVAAVAVVLLAWPNERETCDGGAELVASHWDDDRRVAIEQAFASTGLTYAPAVFTSVAASLDTWRDAWAEAHRGACEAHARGDANAEQLDARMACLRRQLRSLDAVVAVLDAADRDAVGRAQRTVDGLPDVRACEDAVAGIAGSSDPAVRLQLDAARERLSRSLVLADAGRYTEALDLANATYDASVELPDRSLVAEAAYARGYALGQLVRPADAQVAYEESAAIARELGDDRLLAQCARGLVWQLAELGNFDAAETWARTGRASLERIGGSPDDEARLHSALGSLLLDRGRLDEALAEQEAGLAIVRRTFGADDHRMPMYLGNLANVLHVRGSFDEALAKYEEGLAIAERRLGADHPTSLILRSNLVGVLVFLERWPEAEAQAREVVAAQERTLGPEHADLGFSLVGLGSAVEHRDAEAALPHYHRAIAVMEKAFGKESIDLVPALTNLASAELRLGRPADARVVLERARQIQERTYDAPHVDRVFVLASLARIARHEGRIDDAVTLAEQCVQQAKDAGAPEHIVAGTARSEAGAALVAGGRAAEAIVWLEAAASLIETATGPGLELAIVRVRLADAYASDGRVEQARKMLREIERTAISGDRGSTLQAHVALVEAILADDRERPDADARLRAKLSALDPPERARAEALLGR